MAQIVTATRCALVRAEPQHVGELGRILYEAFKWLHEKHGFPLDYPSVTVGREMMFMLVRRKDFYGVAALLDGQLVGSNFLLVADAVAGIGPLTVDPAFEGRGIARALMGDVIEYAERQGLAQIRLMQETFNPRSLSLSASLGFDAKEEVAFLQAVPASQPDRSVRAVTNDDLAVIDQLSTNLYRVSRRNEVAAAVRYASSPLLRERDGKIVGYLIPGINGHGVAETEDDAAALVGEMARRLPAASARFFCPLSESSLFRRMLKMGCHILKIWTLMAMGPYDPPRHVWMPSSTY